MPLNQGWNDDQMEGAMLRSGVWRRVIVLDKRWPWCLEYFMCLIPNTPIEALDMGGFVRLCSPTCGFRREIQDGLNERLHSLFS